MKTTTAKIVLDITGIRGPVTRETRDYGGNF